MGWSGAYITLSATGIGIAAAWILDFRDFCACIYLIHKDGSKSGSFKFNEVSMLRWMLLVIMLVGLVPILGDLLKGVIRIVYLYFKALARKTINQPLLRVFGNAIESALPDIDRLLAHETVKKYLNKLGWRMPYRELANALKKNFSSISNIKELLKIYDIKLAEFKQLATKMGITNDARYKQLLVKLQDVRNALEKKSAELSTQLTMYIQVLIIKLEKADLAKYPAVSGRFTSHYYGRIVDTSGAFVEAKRLPFLKKFGKFEMLTMANGSNYYKLVRSYKGKGNSLDVPDWVIETFHGYIKKKTITGPAKLYRVLDPKSGEDGLHWVTESVFKQLRNRNEWRDKLAVRVDWNANGQFVTFDIPKGQSLEVWSGPAASQPYHETITNLWYQGGAEQIVFNPHNIKSATGMKISQRMETKWGYTDSDLQLLSDRVIIPLDGKIPR